MDSDLNQTYAVLLLDWAEDVRPVTRDTGGGDALQEVFVGLSQLRLNSLRRWKNSELRGVIAELG